jgi:uncharacterized protein (TIGR00288 family)
MNQEHTHAPHRWGTPSEEHSPHAALLIDFDNVTMGIRSNLGAELRKLLDSDIIRGKVSVQRAYADWRRYPQYIVPLSEASIDLIFAPAYGSSRKNATDIRLAIDALEIVFTRPEIGTFILLSGDSDFSSLVLKLKEYGKYVIGVGLQESSSDMLVQNCDEYYSYNTLSGLTSAADMAYVRLDPWELAERAVARMTERGDVMRSDRLKQVMLELDPTFDEKGAGFSKFNRFLAEAAHREIVLLRKAPNGQYEVAPGRSASESTERVEAEPPSRRKAGSKPKKTSSRAAPKPHKAAKTEKTPPAEPTAAPAVEAQVAPSETVVELPTAETPAAEAHAAEVHRIHTADLRHAYDMLREAVGNLAKNREAVRDSEVKRRLLSGDEGFDEGALGFRKFSRFLVQARDEGVIDLSQGEDGNFYLSLPAVEASPATQSRSEAASTPAQEAKRPRAGRGRRGDGRERGPGRGARDERQPEAAPAAEPEPEPQPHEAPEGASETAEVVEATPSARQRQGLGRFRRGSRGRDKPIGEGSGPRLGPVTESSEAPGAERAPDNGDSTEPLEPVEKAPALDMEAAPSRGMGRFRGGSRGRAAQRSPAAGVASEAGEAEAGDAEADEAEAGDAEGAFLDGPAAQAVEHMVRSYPGVGRRTAERLAKEFGSRVFEIIDNEPDRVFAVLTKSRANAVISGREAEKSASAGS